jgi:hypothetical protein
MENQNIIEHIIHHASDDFENELKLFRDNVDHCLLSQSFLKLSIQDQKKLLPTLPSYEDKPVMYIYNFNKFVLDVKNLEYRASIWRSHISLIYGLKDYAWLTSKIIQLINSIYELSRQSPNWYTDYELHSDVLELQSWVLDENLRLSQSNFERFY